MHTSEPAIVVSHATVFLGEQEILHDLTLTLNHREHTAILGPNGSGKSTLIKLITGDVYPLYREPASVRLFGEDRWDLFELRNRLGIVTNALQEKYLGYVTGRDAILSGFFGGVGLHPHEEISPAMQKKVDEICAFLEISALAGKRLEHMSSGEVRRFLIGRALVHDPQMLILDEPYTSLDLKSRHVFAGVVEKIGERGHAIVLVTHMLEEIPANTHRVILMKQGKILAEGEKEKMLTAAMISDLYDLPVQVVEHDGLYHALPERKRA
jgi:iron complex transport system ATP-binding protein